MFVKCENENFIEIKHTNTHTTNNTHKQGASSGIGQDAAFALADLGFDVFASVRKQDDADRLKKAYKERVRFKHTRTHTNTLTHTKIE